MNIIRKYKLHKIGIDPDPRYKLIFDYTELYLSDNKKYKSGNEKSDHRYSNCIFFFKFNKCNFFITPNSSGFHIYVKDSIFYGFKNFINIIDITDDREIFNSLNYIICQYYGIDSKYCCVVLWDDENANDIKNIFNRDYNDFLIEV